MPEFYLAVSALGKVLKVRVRMGLRESRNCSRMLRTKKAVQIEGSHP